MLVYLKKSIVAWRIDSVILSLLYKEEVIYNKEGASHGF